MQKQIPVTHESFKDSRLARVNIDGIVYSDSQSCLRYSLQNSTTTLCAQRININNVGLERKIYIIREIEH